MPKILSCIIILMISNVLFAQSKIAETMSDDSQKKWVRKAVLGIEPVFVENRNIKAPVMKCQDSKCLPLGIFHYDLNDEDIDFLSWNIYEWLITPRYDRITIGEKTSIITTKTSQIAVNIPDMLSFKSGDAKSFDKDVQKYNSIIQGLLSSTIKERYTELSEKEQGTFIVTKAKELGLAKEFIAVLMNSAYIFAVKVNGISAHGTISKVEPKTIMGKTTPGGYSLGFQIDIKADVIIYKYNPEGKSFSHYKTVKARSGGFLLSMMGLGAGTFDSEVFPQEPSLNSPGAIRIFRNSFRSGVKALGISGNYELKKDDNFAIFAPVKEVDGSSVYAACGVGEDIRVDHPMVIQEYIDGEIKKTGYVKARKIGKNCTDPLNTTRFRRIKGKAEEGDQLREHPWTGLMFTFGGGVRDYRISFSEGEVDMGVGGVTAGGQLGLSMDLGYATNLRFFSETWLSLGGYLYGGGGKALDFYNYPFTGGFYLNLSHRIHFTGGGAFFAPQFAFGYGGGKAKVDSRNPLKGDISFSSLFIEPGLQLGFSFTPDVEMIFYGGYQFPVYNVFKKNDKEITNSGGVKFDHGFVASLNFQFHLPVVGATAAIYSKPSKACRQKAGDNEKKVFSTTKDKYPGRPKTESESSNSLPSKSKSVSAKTTISQPVLEPVPPFDETAIKGINLLEVDTEIMVAYDDAVKVEKDKDTINYPERAVDAWKKLLRKDNNPFLSIAESRLVVWLKYYKTIHDAAEKHAKAVENIKKMLSLSSIGTDQKRDAIIKYIETYGMNEGLDPIFDILLKAAEKEVTNKIIKDELFKKASQSLIKRRCESGNGRECYIYSTLLGVGSEDEKAYLIFSCKLNYDPACERLEIINKTEREFLENEKKEKNEGE